MSILDEFRTNKSKQKFLIDALDLLAQIAAEAAREKGFHQDEKEVLDSLCGDPELEHKFVRWTESAILQAELARQMSEIAEAVEAVRKPQPDHHLPEFSNFLVEEADAIIRIMDTVGKRQLPIGEALVSKMLYNLNRPRKHGKES